MPVSYPAQVPTSGITRLSWTNATASLISRSPFTFQGQSQNYPGAIRYARISVENLNREDAEDWVGFLDSLHGTKGTFLFGDPMAKVPMGSGGGNPTLRATSATGRDQISIATDFTTGKTNWLKRGDWIQIGTGLDARLYKILNQVNISGSNGFSNWVYVWPAISRNLVLGESIILDNPKGLFRRSSGVFNYSVENGCKYSLSFDCEEVI